MISIFQFPFIQNAFLAGSIVAVAAALLGFFLVIRGLTFAGHALSNIGFAGAAGAVLLGIHPVFGLLTFTLGSSVAISLLSSEIRERDLVIGVIMSLALALGILFLSLYQGYAEQAYGILFGTILGITRADVLATFITWFVLVAALAIIGRPLLFTSLQPEIAEARGVPVRWLSVIFMILVALAISIAIQVVGVMLVFALLVGPAATAIRLTPRWGLALFLAVILSLVYTWLGIFMAIESTWPVSFFIAMLSFGTYFPVRLLASYEKKRKLLI
jgi:zinc/manganese transport system permease protein